MMIQGNQFSKNLPRTTRSVPQTFGLDGTTTNSHSDICRKTLMRLLNFMESEG